MSRALIYATFIASLACLGAVADLAIFANRPAGAVREIVTVEISRGSGLHGVSAILAAKGLVTSAFRFSVLGRLHRAEKRIKWGEYEFDGTSTPLDILRMLSSGAVKKHLFTIPEGFSAMQVSAKLSKEGLADRAKFDSVLCDGTLASSQGIPAKCLEGYLFPDTYSFTRDMDEVELATAMVKRFREEFDGALAERTGELKMTMHQVVTLASIIEKEAVNGDERFVISGVFHNRLKKGIRLQSDPTVIYAVNRGAGKINIRKEDLQKKDPFNTYVNAGLPPGPIASPGRNSLVAALNPANVPYLYFVARNDGTHQFSTGLKEHNKGVNKYQRPRKGAAKAKKR
jgi:UPF0755 protein